MFCFGSLYHDPDRLVYLPTFMAWVEITEVANCKNPNTFILHKSTWLGWVSCEAHVKLVGFPLFQQVSIHIHSYSIASPFFMALPLGFHQTPYVFPRVPLKVSPKRDTTVHHPAMRRSQAVSLTTRTGEGEDFMRISWGEWHKNDKEIQTI